MKFKKLVPLLITFIVIGSGIFVITSRPSAVQLHTAEKVLTNLLNAPNGDLEVAYDVLQNSSELDYSQVRNVFSELLEHKVTDDFLESCVRINEITSLQHYAMMDGFQARLQELSVKKTQQENSLAYDAVLSMLMDGREEQVVHVSGLVQFDEQGQIDAVTLRGKELFKFYESLLSIPNIT